VKKGVPTIDEVRMHVDANREGFAVVQKALLLRAAGLLNEPMPHALAQLASQLAVALLHHLDQK
jgi:hypothetical protein